MVHKHELRFKISAIYFNKQVGGEFREMTKKRLKNNSAVKKRILLETEALLLESRTKLEKIRAKLQEIADLQLELKVKTMGMSRMIKSHF